MNVSVLINLHNQKLNTCQKTDGVFKATTGLHNPKGDLNYVNLRSTQTRGMTTSKSASRLAPMGLGSAKPAGFANSKEKVQDKVGRNFNKQTFVYQYLLSRLLNGSFALNNNSSLPLFGWMLSNSFANKTKGYQKTKFFEVSEGAILSSNNTLTSFAAASLFIPKVKNGKFKDDKITLLDINALANNVSEAKQEREQASNFFPYRKSFLCYWLFPFVGFVFTLGKNGEIQNSNHTFNYNFNSNSAAYLRQNSEGLAYKPEGFVSEAPRLPYGKASTKNNGVVFEEPANKIIYNIPNKSSKQIEDSLFLYKKLKEDFFGNLNSSASLKKNEALRAALSTNPSSVGARLANKTEGYQKTKFFEVSEASTFSKNSKLYQQCNLYLQSLENYLSLNTNLNELENSLKITLLDKAKLNKADATIQNNIWLHVSSLLATLESPKELRSSQELGSASPALLRQGKSLSKNQRFFDTPASFDTVKQQENYKPFLLKKPFWYEIPYPYFTSINGYEGGKGSEISSTYLDSSLYTVVSKEKTRKNFTFPYIKLRKGISYTFSNVAPFSTTPSAFFAEGDKGLVQTRQGQKHQNFDKTEGFIKATSKFHLKLMVWASQDPTGFFPSLDNIAPKEILGKAHQKTQFFEERSASVFFKKNEVFFDNQRFLNTRGAAPEGQSNPTYDVLGKKSVGLLKTPAVLKKGTLHLKEKSFFKVQENSSFFLSTYSNVNPVSSYLKASVILDNYAKNKSMQSLFFSFPKKRERSFFELDEFCSSFFANGEYDSFIETNLNLSSTSFLFAPSPSSSTTKRVQANEDSKRNVKHQAQKSDYSIVSSILSNSKELNQKNFEGIWTEFLKTVTKKHINSNQEGLKDFKEQSSISKKNGISILIKNAKSGKKLSKETLYKLLLDALRVSLQKSFFSLAQNKESMQRNDTVIFTEVGLGQGENKINNTQIKLSHPILMSSRLVPFPKEREVGSLTKPSVLLAQASYRKPDTAFLSNSSLFNFTKSNHNGLFENTFKSLNSNEIFNKKKIKDFIFTRNALTGFSIDNSKFSSLNKTEHDALRAALEQNKLNKKLNINEYLQYSTFIKKYAANVKNVLLKSRFKESSAISILANKSKRSLTSFEARSAAVQGVYAVPPANSESAKMEKLLRAYFSIKKGKVLAPISPKAQNSKKVQEVSKYSPLFMKKNTLNVLKWTSRLKTKINNQFLRGSAERNTALQEGENQKPKATLFTNSKGAILSTQPSLGSPLEIQGKAALKKNEGFSMRFSHRRWEEKHKFSPRLLIKNRSFIINNRFISSSIKQKGVRSLSRFSVGVVIKPSSYFLDKVKLESYLSKNFDFGFSDKLNNSKVIRKANFIKYNDITKLKQEEQMNVNLLSELTPSENHLISLKKWEYDKVDMSLETKRKYTQKKRRRKKLKKETRRRKKRKRFYPRPNWIRYRLYLNFLKKRYDKNSKTYHNTFSFYKGSLRKSFQNKKDIPYYFEKEDKNLKQTNNRPYIVFQNKEKYVDSSLISLNPSKEHFTISRVVLGDFKRVLWKSYWLRSNLNPYLKRVKTYLTEIKESTQRWEFFKTVNNLVNFLGGFISPFEQSAQNTFALPSLSYSLTAKESTQLNSLGFQDSDLQLGEFGLGISQKTPNLFENYMNFSKWEKSLYLSEYNRITYQRIQEFISQIRENFAAIQGSSEGMGALRGAQGRNTKVSSASSATHISHLNLQDNKREAVLSKRKSTDFWVKLGKTLMAESYAQSTLLKKSWLFKEPTLPQLRMYWAFSKTSYGSFKDFNKRKETWTVGKTREQTKYNKTKKIYRDLSLKLKTLLNEQYELWTSPFAWQYSSKGFTPEFEQVDQVKQEMDSPFWPLVFKNALKKARLKEEKSTFLFNKSVSNNKHKYVNLNTLTLHQYKKNIQLGSSSLKSRSNQTAFAPNLEGLPKAKQAKRRKLKYDSSRFNSPLTISPAPSAWSTKLTNKSSYWWSEALTAKNPLGFELSQLQFLNKTETSRSLRNSESYISQITYRSEDLQGAKKTVTSLFDFETKAFKISALLFHFCSIITLISISQIRDLLKFYFLGISKIYKSSIGILGFSFDLFSSRFTRRAALSKSPLGIQTTLNKEIIPSFGKKGSGLNKSKKQHFFNTKKYNSFTRNNLNEKLHFTSSSTEFQGKQSNKRSDQVLHEVQQAKIKMNSLQFLNKLNSLIRKSFTLYTTPMLKAKVNKEIYNLQTYDQLSKDASWTSSPSVQAQTISLNYQKSSPYANVKELKPFGAVRRTASTQNKTSFLKTYTTLYSLIFINFLLENLNGFYFKTNRLFKQTFDIFGRFGPRSLFNFLEKPGELIGDWIAYMFLVEWSSDMTNTIPENVDVYLGTTTLKATRALHGANLFSINQNLLLPKSPKDIKETSLFGMENFVQNLSILNIGSTFIQRRIYHLYEILLQRFYQPDTDLIVRQKKGIIFWDIWGDFLMQVAEDSNINISELTSLKEEQIKLFEKAQESFTIESPTIFSRFAFSALPTSTKPTLQEAQDKEKALTPRTEGTLFKSPLELQSNQKKVTKNDKKSFRLPKGVKGLRSFIPLFDKGVALTLPAPKEPTINKKQRLFTASFAKSKITEQTAKSTNKGKENHSVSFCYTAKLFQAQQFLSYQGKDTELFIDLHPPKSFSMVSFLKRNESVQHPIGSLVCQIFSGIMLKQISKNILVVGPGSSIGKDGVASGNAAEKTLLIQAIAGETELKIITDNAYRYAMVYRGVAVGIKLLRDVFDSLALHTPCLFLIEDIHAIGERRPLLISDDENTKGAESNSFGSQREEIHEKNQVLYQLNKHVITHYRKPYKGDFSMLIPTNHFCFDLFRRNTGFAGNYPSKKQNLSFNAPRISIKSEKDQSNDSQMSNTSSSTHATVPSRLLVKSSQLFAPPATSPFSVLTLKEEKKFKPYKIVSEMPWGGLPGEQLAQVSKSSYSVRVKVALLADMAISTLSVKLDMITDLLVIIDSVKGNRGFVVFATTHVPYILDPALRRPGRLDETITLGLFPSILSRWEILKSSFGLFTAGKDQTGFNKGLSLDLTYSITFGHHPNRPSLFSNSSSTTEGASRNGEGNSKFSKHTTKNNSSFAEGELTQFSNNIQKNLKIFISTSSVSHKSTTKQVQAKNYSLTHTYTQKIANKLLPSRFYSRSAYFPSLLFLNSSENVIKDRTIKHEISKMNKIQIKRNIHSIFKMSNSSLPVSNKRISLYKRKELPALCTGGANASNQIMQQNQKAPFDINKILSQTYFYASLLLYEASINVKNSPQFLDTPSSLFVTNQTTPLSLYASLYASPQQFKAFIVNFISGKLGETLLFSGIRPSSLVTQNREAINGFNLTFGFGSLFTSPSEMSRTQSENVQNYTKHGHLYSEVNSPSSPKAKSVGVYTSYGLSSTWKALSSLVISFVQKRFLYHSNLIVPKFLYFNNQSSLLEPPSPPSSNILLPARRYENYKRSFSVFSGQQISKKVGIMDKIQAHQQQRLIKRLYGFPVQESFRSEVMENRSTSFSNASLMIGSFSSILQKPSNSNWFVKNRILMRHKNYLTNQWWNGQLSEHNAETTFLSDIDWRSTFVESIGDLILDFPDADQHYNPRNRRWLLTKGSYHNWFDFDKTIYSEIYSHFIFDSFVKAYYIYEQNREVLDFYAYYVLKNGLHNVLNELEILKLYKRFGTSSKPTPPEKQM